MRSLKLNFSATVLTLGLKAKIFENLRLCQAKFWGELRTRATFDRCVARAQSRSQRPRSFWLADGDLQRMTKGTPGDEVGPCREQPLKVNR